MKLQSFIGTGLSFGSPCFAPGVVGPVSMEMQMADYQIADGDYVPFGKHLTSGEVLKDDADQLTDVEMDVWAEQNGFVLKVFLGFDFMSQVPLLDLITEASSNSKSDSKVTRDALEHLRDQAQALLNRLST